MSFPEPLGCIRRPDGDAVGARTGVDTVSGDLLLSPHPITLLLGLLGGVVTVVILVLFWKTLVRYEILVGHIQDFFSALTRVRILTTQYRRLYTLSVALFFISVFFVLIYAAEQAHYRFFDVEPLFTSYVEFFRWISPVALTGFTLGEAPRSLFGAVIIRVMPLFILGTLFAIVAFTTERAHDSLTQKIASGDVPSTRIVLFNYQPRYEPFVSQLLEYTDGFVVLLSPPEHLSEAEALVDSFAYSDSRSYRVHTDSLSDLDSLVDRYSLTEADYIYVLPQRGDDLPSWGTRFLVTLRDRLSRDRRMTDTDREPPQICLPAAQTPFGVSSQGAASAQSFPGMRTFDFHDECRWFLQGVLYDPIEGFDFAYRLGTESHRPDWLASDLLSAYTVSAGDDERDPAPSRSIDIGATVRTGDGETPLSIVRGRPGTHPPLPWLSADRTLHVINTNQGTGPFLESLEQLSAGGDVPSLRLYNRAGTVLESDAATTVIYDSVEGLVRELLGADGLARGDSVVLFLDHGAEAPNVFNLTLVETLHDQLSSSPSELSFGDLLWFVETDDESIERLYRSSPLDYVYNSFRSERNFLYNAVVLGENATVRELLDRGAITATERYRFVTEVAAYFRQYRIDPREPASAYRDGRTDAATVDGEILLWLGIETTDGGGTPRVTLGEPDTDDPDAYEYALRVPWLTVS